MSIIQGLRRASGQRVSVLDHGYVEHVESWGSDERVVESARMSTRKGFRGWGTAEKPGDEKLLAYLHNKKHASPFEMAGMTIEVSAPIIVFREWHRHRTQSYNEASARYAEVPEVFYVPSTERMMSGGQSTSNKQGSGERLSEAVADTSRGRIAEACESSFYTYRELLADGVSRELARLVLPVGTYSTMRASANLRNWLGFLTLRTDPAAQWEIRQFANEVGNIIALDFPRTWALFCNGKVKK